MANHILRLDLSSAARDFQQVALEPGLPMLDRTGANYGILRRWLGRFVAEPACENNQSVQYYVRDEDRGRLGQATCQPATKADLEGNLKADLTTIRDRLKKIKPSSTTEQALHRLALQALGSGDGAPESCDSILFKYREASGAWKLVWCWGYQRKDHVPAASAICHNTECRLLYECRSGEKTRCSSCSASPARASRGSIFSHRIPTAAALMLVLLAVLGAAAWQMPPKLKVTPANWSGPQGASVPYKVVDQRWYFVNRDVTASTVPQSHDRRIIEVDSKSAAAKAKGQGKTQITFRYQDRSADVTFDVGPPRTPKSIAIQPNKVQLADGATTQLRLLGKYDDGSSLDLTGTAQWEVEGSPSISVRKGLVQADGAEASKVKARYRAKQGDDWQEALADVEIAPAHFKSLALQLTPTQLHVGQSGRLQVAAVDDAGKEHSLTGSSKLKLELSPAEIATAADGYVLARTAGKGKVKVSLGKLSQSADFEVTADDRLAAGTFSVQPEALSLAVNEQVKLDVAAASQAPIEIASSDPKIVDVVGSDRLVGRGVGSTTVTLTQGDQKQTVKVAVTDAALTDLWIEPELVSVYVGELSPVKVFASTKEGKEIEIAPSLLKWPRTPSPEIARFDDMALRVEGLAPTKEREKLTVHLGSDLSANAEVEVLPGALPSDLPIKPPATAIADSSKPHKDNKDKDNENKSSTGKVASNKGSNSGTDKGGGGGIGNGAGTAGPGGKDTTGTGAGGIGKGGIAPVGRVGVGTTGPGVGAGNNGGTGVGAGAAVGVPVDVVDVKTPEASLAVQEVKLLGLRISNLARNNFRPELVIAVSDAGYYRVVDSNGEALCDWVLLEANAKTTLKCLAVPRTINNEYDLYVERKIGDFTKRYQFPFKLRADK